MYKTTNKKNRLLAILIASILWIFSNPSSSSVIYDEAVSGDLMKYYPPNALSATLELQPGANTVLGLSSYIRSWIDSDPFFIVLNQGLVLKKVSYRVTDANYVDASQVRTLVSLMTDYYGYFLGENTIAYDWVDITTGNSIDLFLSALPTSESTVFAFAQQGFSRNSPTGGASWNYSIDFEVSEAPLEIPEGETLSLLISGFIALACVGRRRTGNSERSADKSRPRIP